MVTGAVHPEQSDDIEIRDIAIEPVPMQAWLQRATLDVNVTASDAAVPCRVTIVDKHGALVPIAPLQIGAHVAARTGVLYYTGARTRIGVPAGQYRVYASRGFEYNAPSSEVIVSAGQVAKVTLQLRREVTLPDYVSCDTHVHTLEISRHGDSSVDERVLTVAGEGLDVAITTEHNVGRDYAPEQKKKGLEKWYVSIAGNEVTTSMGHFNVFPVDPSLPQPDFRERDWNKLTASLKSDPIRVVIQNHPRDVHSGYRPFDPRWHLASIGENLNGRPIPANAMEVVNSAALSSDAMRTVHDWLGLLTRGKSVAAVGSSDTHTVAFAPIGQARTYIDVSGLADSWKSDQQALAARLAEGRNLVSFGLVAELRQAGPVVHGSKGRIVPMDLRVLGPSWATAERVILYSNGVAVWEERLTNGKAGGVKLAKPKFLTLLI